LNEDRYLTIFILPGSYKKIGVGDLTYDMGKGEIIFEDGELPYLFEYAFGYIKK
jgi:hypothetical protein